MSDTTPRDPDHDGSQEPVAPQVAAEHGDTGDVVMPRDDLSDDADHDTQPRPADTGADTTAGTTAFGGAPSTDPRGTDVGGTDVGGADADASLGERLDEQSTSQAEPAPEHPVTDAYGESPADRTWAPEPGSHEAGVDGERGDDPQNAAYVAAPVSAGTHASADNGQPVVPPADATTQQRPVYVAAPTPPKRKSNRGAGILISILGAVIFAVVYAAVAAAIGAIGGGSGRFLEQYLDFLVRPVFWIPVVFFAIAMIILVLILNRARWWAYIIGGFFVAVVVYLAFVGAALLDIQAWQYTPDEVREFLVPVWVTPFALAAGITAREVSIWMGAWLAARGRRLTASNAEAQADYERRLAEGPQFTPSP